MPNLYFVVPALAALVAPVVADCAANNCLRAVRASAFPTRSGTADCSSFFMVTVTPALSTAYVTVTHTGTETATSVETNVIVTTVPSFTTVVTHTTTTSTSITGVQARNLDGRATSGAVTVSPSVKPDYASACSSLAAYSSACSCIGVTHSTSFAPTPITTSTVTVSSTKTTTVVTETATTRTVTTPQTATSTDVTVVPTTGVYDLCPGQDYFYLYSRGAFAYAFIDYPFGGPTVHSVIPEFAHKFKMDSDSRLLDADIGQYIYYERSTGKLNGADLSTVTSMVAAGTGDFVVCSITNTGGALSCSAAGNSVIEDCNLGEWHLASSLESGCAALPQIQACCTQNGC